jgi:hypothetical protein
MAVLNGKERIVVNTISGVMAVSNSISRLCEEVFLWQKDAKVGYIPRRRCKEVKERKLGSRFAQALLRRFKAVGTKPCHAMLSDDELFMINCIPGVSARDRAR